MTIASPYSFFPGQAVRMTFTVKDMTVTGYPNGVLTDPTAIVFRLHSPAAASPDVFNYPGAAQVTRLSVGVFALDVVPGTDGVWRYSATASGNVSAVDQGTFTVMPTNV